MSLLPCYQEPAALTMSSTLKPTPRQHPLRCCPHPDLASSSALPAPGATNVCRYPDSSSLTSWTIMALQTPVPGEMLHWQPPAVRAAACLVHTKSILSKHIPELLLLGRSTAQCHQHFGGKSTKAPTRDNGVAHHRMMAQCLQQPIAACCLLLTCRFAL